MRHRHLLLYMYHRILLASIRYSTLFVHCTIFGNAFVAMVTANPKILEVFRKAQSST